MLKYYKESLKKPFEDFGKLTIGMFFQIIPLVNLITGVSVTGYLFEYTHWLIKGNPALPDWRNLKKYFKNGIKSAYINSIYLLPILPIILWSVFNYWQVIDATTDPLGNLTILVILLGISGLYLIFLLYISPAIQLAFAENLDVKDALKLKKVFGTAFTINYPKVYAVILITVFTISFVAAILSGLLSITVILPVIITGYSLMVSQIFMYTFLVLNIELK